MQGRHDCAIAKGWQRIARFEYPSSEVSANKPKLVHLSADLFIASLRQTGSRHPSPPPFQCLPRVFSQVDSRRQSHACSSRCSVLKNYAPSTCTSF